MKNFPQNGRVVDEKFIVEYQNDLYDVTEFVLKHPGGVNTLIGYNHKNIDERFKSIDHSPAAKYLLNDYKLNKNLDEFNNNLDDSMEVSRLIEPTFKKTCKRKCFSAFGGLEQRPV